MTDERFTSFLWRVGIFKEIIHANFGQEKLQKQNILMVYADAALRNSCQILSSSW